MEESKLNLWIGNLGKYNEGELVGEWVELPVSDEELQRVLKEAVGLESDADKAFEAGCRGEVVYEEYFIADQELAGLYAELDIGEYSDVLKLNLIAKLGATLSENEKEAVALVLEVEHHDLNEVLNLMLQAAEIPYFAYDYDGAYEKDSWGVTSIERLSPEENLGYTVLEQTGKWDQLEDTGLADYFDVTRYGADLAFDCTLSDSGYVDNCLYDIDCSLYSPEEMKEIVEERWAELQEKEAPVASVTEKLKQTKPAKPTKSR